MSFEEVWARCCFCLGILYKVMYTLIIMYGFQAFLIRIRTQR